MRGRRRDARMTMPLPSFRAWSPVERADRADFITWPGIGCVWQDAVLNAAASLRYTASPRVVGGGRTRGRACRRRRIPRSCKA
jgi:hypothetical protein